MLCFIYLFCTCGLDLSWILSSVCSCLQPGQHRGQAPALPVILIRISSSEKKWMDGHQKLEFNRGSFESFLNGNQVEESGRCDEYLHHIADSGPQLSPGGLLVWDSADYRGSTMDNTNYDNVNHLPHTCHTLLKQQLYCSYTYIGSARGANLCLQATGEASSLHLMGKQILYSRRNDS